VQSVSAIGGTPVAGSEVPNVTYVQNLWRPIVVRAGALNLKASGSDTGEIKWVMTYLPIDAGASVVAA